MPIILYETVQDYVFMLMRSLFEAIGFYLLVYIYFKVSLQNVKLAKKYTMQVIMILLVIMFIIELPNYIITKY